MQDNRKNNLMLVDDESSDLVDLPNLLDDSDFSKLAHYAVRKRNAFPSKPFKLDQPAVKPKNTFDVKFVKKTNNENAAPPQAGPSNVMPAVCRPVSVNMGSRRSLKDVFDKLTPSSTGTPNPLERTLNFTKFNFNLPESHSTPLNRATDMPPPTSAPVVQQPEIQSIVKSTPGVAIHINLNSPNRTREHTLSGVEPIQREITPVSHLPANAIDLDKTPQPAPAELFHNDPQSAIKITSVQTLPTRLTKTPSGHMALPSAFTHMSPSRQSPASSRHSPAMSPMGLHRSPLVGPRSPMVSHRSPAASHRSPAQSLRSPLASQLSRSKLPIPQSPLSHRPMASTHSDVFATPKSRTPYKSSLAASRLEKEKFLEVLKIKCAEKSLREQSSKIDSFVASVPADQAISASPLRHQITLNVVVEPTTTPKQPQPIASVETVTAEPTTVAAVSQASTVASPASSVVNRVLSATDRESLDDRHQTDINMLKNHLRNAVADEIIDEVSPRTSQILQNTIMKRDLRSIDDTLRSIMPPPKRTKRSKPINPDVLEMKKLEKTLSRNRTTRDRRNLYSKGDSLSENESQLKSSTSKDDFKRKSNRRTTTKTSTSQTRDDSLLTSDESDCNTQRKTSTIITKRTSCESEDSEDIIDVFQRSIHSSQQIIYSQEDLEVQKTIGFKAQRELRRSNAVPANEQDRAHPEQSIQKSARSKKSPSRTRNPPSFSPIKQDRAQPAKSVRNTERSKKTPSRAHGPQSSSATSEQDRAHNDKSSRNTKRSNKIPCQTQHSKYSSSSESEVEEELDVFTARNRLRRTNEKSMAQNEATCNQVAASAASQGQVKSTKKREKNAGKIKSVKRPTTNDPDSDDGLQSNTSRKNAKHTFNKATTEQRSSLNSGKASKTINRTVNMSVASPRTSKKSGRVLVPETQSKTIYDASDIDETILETQPPAADLSIHQASDFTEFSHPLAMSQTSQISSLKSNRRMSTPRRPKRKSNERGSSHSESGSSPESVSRRAAQMKKKQKTSDTRTAYSKYVVSQAMASEPMEFQPEVSAVYIPETQEAPNSPQYNRSEDDDEDSDTSHQSYRTAQKENSDKQSEQRKSRFREDLSNHRFTKTAKRHARKSDDEVSNKTETEARGKDNKRTDREKERNREATETNLKYSALKRGYGKSNALKRPKEAQSSKLTKTSKPQAKTSDDEVSDEQETAARLKERKRTNREKKPTRDASEPGSEKSAADADTSDDDSDIPDTQPQNAQRHVQHVKPSSKSKHHPAKSILKKSRMTALIDVSQDKSVGQELQRPHTSVRNLSNKPKPTSKKYTKRMDSVIPETQSPAKSSSKADRVLNKSKPRRRSRTPESASSSDECGVPETEQFDQKSPTKKVSSNAKLTKHVPKTQTSQTESSEAEDTEQESNAEPTQTQQSPPNKGNSKTMLAKHVPKTQTSQTESSEAEDTEQESNAEPTQTQQSTTKKVSSKAKLAKHVPQTQTSQTESSEAEDTEQESSAEPTQTQQSPPNKGNSKTKLAKHVHETQTSQTESSEAEDTEQESNAEPIQTQQSPTKKVSSKAKLAKHVPQSQTSQAESSEAEDTEQESNAEPTQTQQSNCTEQENTQTTAQTSVYSDESDEDDTQTDQQSMDIKKEQHSQQTAPSVLNGDNASDAEETQDTDYTHQSSRISGAGSEQCESDEEPSNCGHNSDAANSQLSRRSNAQRPNDGSGSDSDTDKDEHQRPSTSKTRAVVASSVKKMGSQSNKKPRKQSKPSETDSVLSEKQISLKEHQQMEKPSTSKTRSVDANFVDGTGSETDPEQMSSVRPTSSKTCSAGTKPVKEKNTRSKQTSKKISKKSNPSASDLELSESQMSTIDEQAHSVQPLTSKKRSVEADSGKETKKASSKKTNTKLKLSITDFVLAETKKMDKPQTPKKSRSKQPNSESSDDNSDDEGTFVSCGSPSSGDFTHASVLKPIATPTTHTEKPKQSKKIINRKKRVPVCHKYSDNKMLKKFGAPESFRPKIHDSPVDPTLRRSSRVRRDPIKYWKNTIEPKSPLLVYFNLPERKKSKPEDNKNNSAPKISKRRLDLGQSNTIGGTGSTFGDSTNQDSRSFINDLLDGLLVTKGPESYQIVQLSKDKVISKKEDLVRMVANGVEMFCYATAKNVTRGYMKFHKNGFKKRCFNKGQLELLVLKGAITVTTTDEVLNLVDGDLVRLLPGIRYSLNNTSENMATIYFSKTDLEGQN